MDKNVSKEVKRIIICCIASCIIAVNIRTFVRTGGLFPGGANGLTLLIQSIFDRYLHITIPYTAINVLLNAIPVYIGFRFIGKKFTLCSCLVIFLTGFLTDSLPAYTITSDILLISIFGGLINGFAISLCLKCDATTGGTDFISIFLSPARFARQIRRHLLTVCPPTNWKAISISGRSTSTSSFLFILALTFLEVKCLYGYVIHI